MSAAFSYTHPSICFFVWTTYTIVYLIFIRCPLVALLLVHTLLSGISQAFSTGSSLSLCLFNHIFILYYCILGQFLLLLWASYHQCLQCQCHTVSFSFSFSISDSWLGFYLHVPFIYFQLLVVHLLTTRALFQYTSLHAAMYFNWKRSSQKLFHKILNNPNHQ